MRATLSEEPARAHGGGLVGGWLCTTTQAWGHTYKVCGGSETHLDWGCEASGTGVWGQEPGFPLPELGCGCQEPGCGWLEPGFHLPELGCGWQGRLDVGARNLGVGGRNPGFPCLHPSLVARETGGWPALCVGGVHHGCIRLGGHVDVLLWHGWLPGAVAATCVEAWAGNQHMVVGCAASQPSSQPKPCGGGHGWCPATRLHPLRPQGWAPR